MSADNHQGQEDKSFQQQAGYMRAMISSHINVKMSCKRSGFIYAQERPFRFFSFVRTKKRTSPIKGEIKTKLIIRDIGMLEYPKKIATNN